MFRQIPNVLITSPSALGNESRAYLMPHPPPHRGPPTSHQAQPRTLPPPFEALAEAESSRASSSASAVHRLWAGTFRKTPLPRLAPAPTILRSARNTSTPLALRSRSRSRYPSDCCSSLTSKIMEEFLLRLRTSYRLPGACFDLLEAHSSKLVAKKKALHQIPTQLYAGNQRRARFSYDDLPELFTFLGYPEVWVPTSGRCCRKWVFQNLCHDLCRSPPSALTVSARSRRLHPHHSVAGNTLPHSPTSVRARSASQRSPSL